MAKATGPLFSLQAHGSIAKILTYKPWNGTCQVGRWRKTPSPDTAAQVIARRKFSNASFGLWWASHTIMQDEMLSDTDKKLILAIPPPQQIPWHVLLIQAITGSDFAHMDAAFSFWNSHFSPSDKADWEATALALTPSFKAAFYLYSESSSYRHGLNLFFYRWGLYKLRLLPFPVTELPSYV